MQTCPNEYYRTCAFRLCRSRHTKPKREQCAHVCDILQTFQQWDEVQQVMICWVTDPAFDWDGIICIGTSA